MTVPTRVAIFAPNEVGTNLTLLSLSHESGVEVIPVVAATRNFLFFEREPTTHILSARIRFRLLRFLSAQENIASPKYCLMIIDTISHGIS